jgi:hypothetical protein
MQRGFILPAATACLKIDGPFGLKKTCPFYLSQHNKILHNLQAIIILNVALNEDVQKIPYEPYVQSNISVDDGRIPFTVIVLHG